MSVGRGGSLAFAPARSYAISISGNPSFAGSAAFLGNDYLAMSGNYWYDYYDSPRMTRQLRAKQERVATGKDIREIDNLVDQYGGKAGQWRKYKSWDEHGREWGWYEHAGIGVKQLKPK